MAMQTRRQRRFGGFSPEQQVELVRVLERDIQQRNEPRFAKGNLVNTDYGLRTISRPPYYRSGRYIDGVWVAGWMYETKLLTDGTKEAIAWHYGRRSSYVRDFRTFREDQLVAWNPNGPYVEVILPHPRPLPNVLGRGEGPPIVGVGVSAPIYEQKLLTGNTMDTPLLPAWSSDIRCVARDVLDILLII